MAKRWEMSQLHLLKSYLSEGCRPVWEGVSTHSLKFHAGPPCPTLIRPAGGWPAAVFFPLGYPFPYGPGRPHLLLVLFLDVDVAARQRLQLRRVADLQSLLRVEVTIRQMLNG
jgi:hypothetical protein